jgi:hypothetical protein
LKHFGAVNLDRVKTVSDLGILLVKKLTFKHHCDLHIGKASGLLGFINRRTTEVDNIWVTKTLYCRYVSSVLKFGSVVIPQTI